MPSPGPAPTPSHESLRERFLSRLDARGTYPRWVLVASLAGMFATTFPVTILTVSLGAIAEELSAEESTITWVISAPLLLSALTLPLLGKLGDLTGHRRTFLGGFGAATAVAFLTALAWDAPSLIGLRSLAAICGGATHPSSMALIFSVYGPVERVRAMGWWSMMGAAAPATGLIAGGPLVDLLGWRVLFIIQGLLSVVALALAALVLRETPSQKVRFDIPGAFTLSVGVGGLMFALGRFRDLGPASPWIHGAAVVGMLGLAVFVRVERGAPAPLLPLEYFKHRDFSAPIVSNAFQSAAYMGAFVLAPLLLLDVFSFSISAAAGIMLLRTLTLSISSPLGGYLGQGIGERAATVIGSAIMTGALVLMVWASARGSLFAFGISLVLQGLGHGLSTPSLTSSVASAVSLEDLGIGAAARSLTGQVGTAFGITLFTLAYGSSATGGNFPFAFGVGAVLSALSLLAAAFMAPRR